MTTKTALVAAAVATLVATGLAACGSSSNGGGGAKGGGTLTIQGDAGNPTLVENFNPFVAATELHGGYLMYEPLEFRSPVDGTFTPFLATGHKFTDPKTLDFTIRQNVKWSDGQPFTAADVVFTFNLIKKYPALDGNGVWAQITGVATSGNDVTVTFKAPNVPFAGVVAKTPIVPEHLWSSVPDPTKFTNTKPVGTGPFTLDKFAPTQYSLKKNPTYWQAAKIAPSEVLFPAQSSNQATNQLDVSSGKFDWSYNFLPNVQKTYVSRSKTNIYWFPPGGVITLYLNLTKAPYNDANFRKGISLALDRTTIAQKAVNGYLDAASQSGLILPNLKKWLDPSLPDQGVVKPDPAAAQAAFAQAGYTMQGGKLVKDGKQASMSIVMPNNFTDWVAAAKEVSTQLGQVGIKASLDLPQFPQYQSSIQAGTFDAAIGGFGGTGDPYTDFNNALNSSFAAPVKTATANNFERFKDPTVDQALATLAAATDPEAQQQATHTLEQVMYKQVPAVLMYYGGSWGLFSTKNFTGWPSADNPYTLPTSYDGSLLLVVTRLTKA
ncbi:MAG TPA: ABC transporter substrate-binding protein [Jatrophihabitantaceae bacterium]|nr:ABC transporter substrate-binding protein [Jatrophihabitantaceae bacterium]